jgi:hypothetical protein
MRYFEGAGYECYRMAGSHTAFDVIALNRREVLLIQVKGGTASMSPLEVEKALMAAAPPNSTKLLVCWPDRTATPVTKEIR